MRALVTGASSGIGRDIARVLSNLGHDIIIVARDGIELEKLKKELSTKVEIISIDLSKKENCIALYESVKNKKIDILVNNAGFGDFGEFINKGYILNVASIAGFMSGGPLMATYYSTKSYIVKLTQSIYTELKRKKSKVKISLLCPGPVNTNFNKVANVKFNLKALSSEYVAKYGIDNMLKGKFVILPGTKIKIVKFLSHISPEKLVSRICMKMQERKT